LVVGPQGLASMAIFAVSFLLNLTQASQLLGMTREGRHLHGERLLEQGVFHHLVCRGSMTTTVGMTKGRATLPWESGCTGPGKDRVVESHILRKTSEIWDTQGLRSGQRFGPSVFGNRGSLVVGRLLRRLVCRLGLVLALPGPLLVRRLRERASFRLALGRA
jgi:hypothetical protein